jgi:hypothetical protein
MLSIAPHMASKAIADLADSIAARRKIYDAAFSADLIGFAQSMASDLYGMRWQ